MKSLHKDSWKANVSLYQKYIFCNKTNEIYIGNKEKYIINPNIHILISKASNHGSYIITKYMKSVTQNKFNRQKAKNWIIHLSQLKTLQL